MSNTTGVEEFIRKYKIAQKHKWSREQFGELVDMIPDSVRRQVGKIRNEFGIQLAHLPLNGDKKLTPDMLDKFTEEYDKQIVKLYGVRKSGKRFIITSAQNNTPVHTGFLNSIEMYAEYNDAEILVIPFHYKNTASVFNSEKNEENVWAPKIQKYLMDTKAQLCNNLFVLGNIKVTPTTDNVLAGFESVTGTSSTIIGHAKVQLVSVPTMDKKSKLLISTGAVTNPNYNQSKAGSKGDFHHCLAAVVVEIEDNGTFHLRHVHASKNGSFYDLDKLYTPTEITSHHRALALITGDTHVAFLDDTVEKATYDGPDSLCGVLTPEHLVFHDLCDFYSRNHHHRGDDVKAVGKHRYGRNNVQEELQDTANFIDKVSRKNTLNVIIKSNHDEAFDRWLLEFDPKSDPENSQFYYYMKYNQLKHVRKTPTGTASIDPLEFWCLNPENGKGLRNIKGTKFLKRNESFKVADIELAYHGDVGANGSRGSTKGFAKLSNKMVTGHTHTPSIMFGCYTVGMSAKLDLEYNRGPSSWMHTHCVIYPDGKRTLIHIINGSWKA